MLSSAIKRGMIQMYYSYGMCIVGWAYLYACHICA